MTIGNVLAFVAVRDTEAAIRWCKMLLGREPDAQPLKDWLNGNLKREDGFKFTRTSNWRDDRR
jgi:hypothetical protein